MESDKERFYITPEAIESQKWSEYRFIMPTISVGQVGQLAIDLLLNNLGNNVNKVGVIYSNAILPIIGREQSDNNGLCMGLELYESREHKMIILQQRAPFIKGRIPSFRKRLITWIKDSCFTNVFVLAGVSSHIRKDAELVGSLFRFLTIDEELKIKFTSEYKWREYIIKKSDDSDKFQMPGSGILRSMYEDCTKEGISFCGFVMFCNPGNTICEAVQLVEHMQTFMDIFDDSSNKRLKMPDSWNFPGDELKSNYIF